jgi:hypothetical protein
MTLLCTFREANVGDAFGNPDYSFSYATSEEILKEALKE